MNRNLTRLYDIARKPERLIIGLMSGTSLDGLDVALCRFRGSGLATRVTLLEFTTVSYTAQVKDEIRAVFSKRTVDLEKICLLNAWIGRLHARMVLDCLQAWGRDPGEVDVVASHGQTIYHAPKSQHGQDTFPDATLQIGDGDHIAVQTGIITLSDFRQKHVAAGGEGAPLAVYGDYLILSGRGEDRVLLNIGGIANFTYLPGSVDATRIFSTDVGPGNTLIDAFTRRYFPEKAFDENGTIAASGQVSPALLKALHAHPFFAAPFPKTTGPELFSEDYVRQRQAQSGTENLSPQDLIATLTRFTAEAIAEAVLRSTNGRNPPVLYGSGGGMHNPVIVRYLRELLPGYVLKDTASIGVLPDAKEAVLFAVLANETVAGGEVQFGHLPGVTMGKVSFPG